MFSPETLFIRNVDLLKKATDEPSTENLFDSGRLLRQLLFDENPLLHQVNRERRLKIIFEANMPTQFPEGLEPDHYWMMEGISPRLGRPRASPPAQVNLDGFFKLKVAFIKPEWITAKDIVQYVANYGGAVHKSPPDTPTTKSLELIAQTLAVGGSPSVLRSLRGLCDVAVAGCNPLYEALQKEQPG